MHHLQQVLNQNCCFGQYSNWFWLPRIVCVCACRNAADINGIELKINYIMCWGNNERKITDKNQFVLWQHPRRGGKNLRHIIFFNAWIFGTFSFLLSYFVYLWYLIWKMNLLLITGLWRIRVMDGVSHSKNCQTCFSRWYHRNESFVNWKCYAFSNMRT